MADETTHYSVGGDARVETVVQSGRIDNIHVHLAERESSVPFQLPPDNRPFVDRETQRAAVDAAASKERQGPLVVALSGLGGIGKTALSHRLARTLAARCPDGVLYVDLDDHRGSGAGIAGHGHQPVDPADPAEALGELLEGLGVPPTWLRRSATARRGQYWSLTAERRVVVLLDNVRHGAEALPLLPSGPGCVAILASHGPLRDLDGAIPLSLPLEQLAEPDAVELLRRLVDDERPAEEPEALAELARRCGGLPAALHVAGQWVRRHPRRPLARLAAQLRTRFQDEGMPVTEPVWDAAYAALGPTAARLYRLLPLHPAPQLSALPAAALLGTDPDEADDALDELIDAGLLQYAPKSAVAPAEPGLAHPDLARPDLAGARPAPDSPTPDRLAPVSPAPDRPTPDSPAPDRSAGRGHDTLRLHDLLRGHAERCRARDAGPEEAAEARTRLIRWYRRQAARADALAAGPRLTLAPALPEPSHSADVELAGKADALRWLEAERAALFGCVALAYEEERDEDAWALCEPLWTHYLDHPHDTAVVETFRHGVAAAQRAGELRALVRLRCQLARPLWEQGRFEEAGEQLRHALAGAELLGEGDGDRKLVASTVEFRGNLSAAQGAWTDAERDFEASRQIHAAIGNAYGVLLQTYQLGKAAAAQGHLDRAVPLLREAHTAAHEQGRERITARTGFELGRALARTGRPEDADEARARYAAALSGARARGSTAEEARVLGALAELVPGAEGGAVPGRGAGDPQPLRPPGGVRWRQTSCSSSRCVGASSRSACVRPPTRQRREPTPTSGSVHACRTEAATAGSVRTTRPSAVAPGAIRTTSAPWRALRTSTRSASSTTAAVRQDGCSRKAQRHHPSAVQPALCGASSGCGRTTRRTSTPAPRTCRSLATPNSMARWWVPRELSTGNRSTATVRPDTLSTATAKAPGCRGRFLGPGRGSVSATRSGAARPSSPYNSRPSSSRLRPRSANAASTQSR
ncbi:tetratricopeptide (TPR) repeat protein [Streptacidiphilus sp. MAP12-33]|uniref:hypothetical protein n=1 Tax=Streptacidiphilus sp. MAP12-33 TaxID=3156266 RepID=UPI003512AB45